MSLKELFGGKRKDLAKTIDEAEAGEDFTPDCPVIVELKQDKELNKELNIQMDTDYYNLNDFLKLFKLSDTKVTHCTVKIRKIDDSTVQIIFHEGKLLLKSDFTFDWEIWLWVNIGLFTE